MKILGGGTVRENGSYILYILRRIRTSPRPLKVTPPLSLFYLKTYMYFPVCGRFIKRVIILTNPGQFMQSRVTTVLENTEKQTVCHTAARLVVEMFMV